MKKFMHFFGYVLFVLSSTVFAQNMNSFSDDLIYDKMDRQVPSNVNDDHMTVRKIKKSEQEKLSVSGGNIYFEIDKASINSTEMIKIEEIAKALVKLGSRVEKIAIEGFASSRLLNSNSSI